MQTVMFTCDRCKTSWDIVNGRAPEGKQTWCVEVAIYTPDAQYRTSSGRRSAEWCRPCVELAGFLPYVDTVKSEEIPPPSIEDLIREIVQQALDGGHE